MAKSFAPRVAKKQRKTIDLSENLSRDLLKLADDRLLKGAKLDEILIKDIIRDRRRTVDIVRDTIGGINYKRYGYVSSKDELNRIINKANQIISVINNSHKKIDNKLFDHNNWTSVVGKYLTNLRKNIRDSDYDEN